MAGIPTTYYRVCDKCGEIVSIASDDPSAFTCSECGSDSAWEYPLKAKAVQHSLDIRNRNSRLREQLS